MTKGEEGLTFHLVHIWRVPRRPSMYDVHTICTSLTRWSPFVMNCSLQVEEDGVDDGTACSPRLSFSPVCLFNRMGGLGKSVPLSPGLACPSVQAGPRWHSHLFSLSGGM